MIGLLNPSMPHPPKRIRLINGHPDPESFNFALAAAYKTGAVAAGLDVRELVIRDLQFSPNLRFGYRQRCELEPDLLRAQELIKWANHLVWIYPVWWAGMPGLLKGFLDRTFLPGLPFRNEKTRCGGTSCSPANPPGSFPRWISHPGIIGSSTEPRVTRL